MLEISSKHCLKSMVRLRRNVFVSQRYLTLGALRSEFRKWNKEWKNGWRMRPVRLQGGGYAGVLRPRNLSVIRYPPVLVENR